MNTERENARERCIGVDQQCSIEGAFRRHVKNVYRLCYSYLGNAADAEDATQAVFVKLIDTQQEFRDIEHEKAWLLRVAINHCKDVLKSAARMRTQSLTAPDGSQLDVVDENPFGAKADVLQAVLALPEIYKDCVYLYYYEGYKTGEIANMTQSNPSTVRNRLVDARKMLKDALEV